MTSYLDELSRELGRRGIRGRLRARVVAECADHLAMDPAANLGPPANLANEFAAELGAEAARRSALTAFAALAAAGAAFATCFLSLAFANAPAPGESTPLAAITFALIVLAPQVSFVAGALAALRAFRRRSDRVLPTLELAVVNRRTAVALGAGLLTMAALASYAFALRDTIAPWWPLLAYASAGSASILIVVAALPAARAARLRPQIAGDGGDVFDDLGVERLRMDPWRFARLVAVAAGAAVWLAGVAQDDPFDGFFRGACEGLACFGGFAALGKFLGLRR